MGVRTQKISRGIGMTQSARVSLVDFLIRRGFSVGLRGGAWVWGRGKNIS